MDGDILNLTTTQIKRRRRKFIDQEIKEWRKDKTGHHTNDTVKYLKWLENMDMLNRK